MSQLSDRVDWPRAGIDISLVAWTLSAVVYSISSVGWLASGQSKAAALGLPAELSSMLQASHLVAKCGTIPRCRVRGHPFSSDGTADANCIASGQLFPAQR
ncbi:hypothetical protein BN1723_007415 [Verticillium longisporum]|uniref:Uncharacterized protein n=1 Tax=Verticillium longisporum TaxID=100787 RepID=A0A0G4NLA8_VERLO|nr:hypothetical protein BN1723_007415 [Verticillium longisporum]